MEYLIQAENRGIQDLFMASQETTEKHQLLPLAIEDFLLSSSSSSSLLLLLLLLWLWLLVVVVSCWLWLVVVLLYQTFSKVLGGANAPCGGTLATGQTRYIGQFAKQLVGIEAPSTSR